jgi:hypothetical protein
MKHLRVIAASLVIAIAGIMFGATASSQINIQVNPQHRTRHLIVHHPRNRVHVRVYVPERRRVVRHHQEHRAIARHQERQDNR